MIILVLFLSFPLFSVVGLTTVYLTVDSIVLTYVILGYGGWTAMYITSTYNLATDRPSVDEGISDQDSQFLIGFSMYINFALGIGAICATIVHIVSGLLVISLAIAIFYPPIDLLLAEKHTSPAEFILKLSMMVSHKFGLLTKTSANKVTDRIRHF
jgi:hypothetical protein